MDKMMGYEWNMMAGWGFFGSVLTILVIVVLVLLAVYLWKKIQEK